MTLPLYCECHHVIEMSHDLWHGLVYDSHAPAMVDVFLAMTHLQGWNLHLASDQCSLCYLTIHECAWHHQRLCQRHNAIHQCGEVESIGNYQPDLELNLNEPNLFFMSLVSLSTLWTSCSFWEMILLSSFTLASMSCFALVSVDLRSFCRAFTLASASNACLLWSFSFAVRSVFSL